MQAFSKREHMAYFSTPAVGQVSTVNLIRLMQHPKVVLLPWQSQWGAEGRIRHIYIFLDFILGSYRSFLLNEMLTSSLMHEELQSLPHSMDTETSLNEDCGLPLRMPLRYGWLKQAFLICCVLSAGSQVIQQSLIFISCLAKLFNCRSYS